MNQLQATDQVGSTSDATVSRERPTSRAHGEYHPGDELDRYELVAKLGQGGFGVVWEANDPSLQRRVALKLLHDTWGRDGGPRARLRREAVALASLSHPNVVEIFDTGLTQGRVFISMELVRGQTLSDWAAGRPSLHALLDAFDQAARGLAAVHRAGLVHRDLKPANMMRTSSGRVLVMDFGLARLTTAELDRHGTEEDARLSSDARWTLTSNNVLLGSPAYMAPEQISTGHTDASSDQYSLCVSFFELLSGYRPHRAGSLQGLAQAKRSGELDFSRSRIRIPPQVRALLTRGMAVRPEERFDDLESLRAALAAIRRSEPRRRRVFAVALGLVSVLAANRAYSEAEPLAGCDETRARGEQLWNADVKHELEASFSQTELAYAPDTAARASALIEDAVERWDRGYEATCETHRQGHGSIDDRQLQLQCFDRVHRAMSNTLNSLRDADERAVDVAIERIRDWPRSFRCEDPARIRSSGVVGLTPQLRALEQQVQARLDRSQEASYEGDFDSAIKLASSAIELARSHEHLVLEARASLRLSEAYIDVGDAQRAREHLADAVFSGQRSGDHETVAVSASTLVFLLSNGLEDFDKVQRWAGHARESLAHVAEPGPLQAQLSNNVAIAHAAYVSEQSARPYFLRALSESIEATGPESSRTASAHFNAGMNAMKLGHMDEAEQSIERALAISADLFGARHPKYASILAELAYLHSITGRSREAVVQFDIALEIQRQTLGGEHHQYLSSLGNRSRALARIGRLGEAERGLDQVLELAEATWGPDHPNIARILATRAFVQRERGLPERSLAQARRGLRILGRTAHSLPFIRQDLWVNEY